jgi:DNA-binding transcriptional LysR family regulator
VTPGKWVSIWNERFPRRQLDLELMQPVRELDTQLAVLREGAADVAFVRLPLVAAGETPERPADIHLIKLYEELPYVVAPKDHALEAADAVTAPDLAGETRHPFDDDIEMTIEVVAANVGVVVVPQSLARLYARKDVVARPVADEPGWRVGIAWRADAPAEVQPLIDDFVGVVRGRTANSSRSAATPPSGDRDRKAQRSARSQQQREASAKQREQREQARAAARAGRSGRKPTR